MDAQEAKRMYHDPIVAKGSSKSMRRMCCGRVEAFLRERPEAPEADGRGLRAICDDHVAGLPVTSATEVATAVRHFRTMRLGKPCFRRTGPSDFPRDRAIKRKADEFVGFPRRSGLDEATVINRVRFVRQFPCTMSPGGSLSREPVHADAVRKFTSARMADASRSFRSGLATETRSYARLPMSGGAAVSDVAPLPPEAPSRVGDAGAVLPDEGYEAILAVPDGRTLRGMRDRVIIILMSNLGLRASDVARSAVRAEPQGRVGRDGAARRRHGPLHRAVRCRGAAAAVGV